MFKENIGEHGLLNNEGDIILCWHITKETITQGVYLHITKEWHGTLNNDSTYKTSRLLPVTPIFERVILV